MTALTRSFRRRLQRHDRAAGTGDAAVEPPPLAADAPPEQEAPVEIAPNDPLLAYFQSASEAVDIEALDLDSPALRELKAAGVKLAVPLVSQGELIGVLNLGPRLSEQDYSSDDRRLLDNLAAQAAPALRVAQLVREQEAEAATSAALRAGAEVARLIQQHFLPKELPELPGWQIAAFYRPAREVGGDFYDVIPLPDGRLGFVIGDVTDKGVPAALVMSATRSVLRASAQRLIEPGEVLERVNDLLVPRHPGEHVRHLPLRRARPRQRAAALRQRRPRPALRPDGRRRGRAARHRHAARPDAGHALRGEGGHACSRGQRPVPLRRGGRGPQPRARDVQLPAAEGDDGRRPGGQELIDHVLLASSRPSPGPARAGGRHHAGDPAALRRRRRGAAESNGRVLAEFELPSEPGNERLAMAHVAEAVAGLGLEPARLERLKTAVAEATMNAMEHGNEYRADRPGRDSRDPAPRAVARADHRSGRRRRASPTPETPDLEAKLDGRQTPRGWGLFLIEKMVDEMHVTSEGADHPSS